MGEQSLTHFAYVCFMPRNDGVFLPYCCAYHELCVRTPKTTIRTVNRHTAGSTGGWNGSPPGGLPSFLGKHIVEGEYTNRLYRPLHFLSVILESVSTQEPFTIFQAKDAQQISASCLETSPPEAVPGEGNASCPNRCRPQSDHRD